MGNIPRLYQTSISPLRVRTSMMVWPRKSSDSRLKCCFTRDLMSSSSSHTRTLMRSVALWHSLQVDDYVGSKQTQQHNCWHCTEWQFDGQRYSVEQTDKWNGQLKHEYKFRNIAFWFETVNVCMCVYMDEYECVHGFNVICSAWQEELPQETAWPFLCIFVLLFSLSSH